MAVRAWIRNDPTWKSGMTTNTVDLEKTRRMLAAMFNAGHSLQLP